MKRLTEKNESPCTCCGGIGSCRTDCSYKQLYDRLAEYEDTGLEPQEIMEAIKIKKGHVYQYPTIFGKDFMEVKELIDAEGQGLLGRLPCELGDTVYWIMECSCRNIDGVYSKCEFYGYEPDYGADCEICNRPEGTKCPHQYRISAGRAREQNILMIARSLGKTVFLTREAAEKTLEGIKNEA